MPEATLSDYDELAFEVAKGTHPIMPRPQWGQNAAMVAFFIDRMQDELKRLRYSMSDQTAIRHEMWEQALQMVEDLQVLVKVLSSDRSPHGSERFQWARDNLGAPYRELLLLVVGG